MPGKRSKRKRCLPEMGWSENLASLRLFGILAMVFGLLLYMGISISSEERSSSQFARFKQMDADFKSFESALAVYKLNAGSYPSTAQGLGALVVKPALQPVPRRWTQAFEKLRADPWGQPYLYRFPSRKFSEKFEIISMGPDGMPGTADDVGSQDE